MGSVIFGFVVAIAWLHMTSMSAEHSDGGKRARPILAGFLGLLAGVTVAQEGPLAIVALCGFAYTLFLWWDTWSKTRGPKAAAAAKAKAEAKVQALPDDPSRPLHWSERPLDEDWKRDVEARGEQRYSPTLVYPMSATAVKPNREQKSAGERKESRRTRKPRRDAVIDVIRFDYEDRNGDPSTREIEVTAISDEYFEGWCRESQGKRTFRLDRVTGDVVSLETGEIDNPYAWAGEHMDDDRNDGVDDSRWFH